MKKIFLIPLLVIAALSMSGCGWLFGNKGMFRDRSNDYRLARLEKPLQVPAGLSTIPDDGDYGVPKIGNSALLHGKFVVPRPEGISGDPNAEKVKIEKLGPTTWILVEASPGEVWPRVREFLDTNQLYVARADATDGIIETGWLRPKNTKIARERYRFRIDQGVQRNSSEVYVLQDAGGSGDSDNWPKTSTDPAREDDMIKALAQYIADNGITGSVSMLAQRGIDSRGKVFMKQPVGGEPYLRLELPFERAWASLTLALPKAGFTVDDRNRSAHKFWVRYTPHRDPADQPGWWSRFWSWVFGDTDPLHDTKTVYELSVTPVAKTQGTKTQGTKTQDTMRIELSRQDGKAMKPVLEEELLNRIKNKLS